MSRRRVAARGCCCFCDALASSLRRRASSSRRRFVAAASSQRRRLVASSSRRRRGVVAVVGRRRVARCPRRVVVATSSHRRLHRYRYPHSILLNQFEDLSEGEQWGREGGCSEASVASKRGCSEGLGLQRPITGAAARAWEAWTCGAGVRAQLEPGQVHPDPPGSRCTQIHPLFGHPGAPHQLLGEPRCTRFIVASSSPRRRRVAVSSPHRRRRSSSPLSSPPPPSSPCPQRLVPASSSPLPSLSILSAGGCRARRIRGSKVLCKLGARGFESRLRAREGQGEPSRFEAAWGRRALARASLLARRGFRAARERAVVVWSPEIKARS